MGPLAVVDLKPLRGDRAQLGDRLEEMRVQHFGSVAAIEALDVGVLIRALEHVAKLTNDPLVL